jgi:hypothetical protein
VRNSILHHLKGLQSSLDYNDTSTDKINHDNNHDHQDNEDEANSL